MRLRFATREEIILMTDSKRSLSDYNLAIQAINYDGYSAFGHRINLITCLIGKTNESVHEDIINMILSKGAGDVLISKENLSNEAIKWLMSAGLTMNDVEASYYDKFVIPGNFYKKRFIKKEKNFIEKGSIVCVNKGGELIEVKESFKTAPTFGHINDSPLIEIIVDKNGNHLALNNKSKIIDKEFYDKYK